MRQLLIRAARCLCRRALHPVDLAQPARMPPAPTDPGSEGSEWEGRSEVFARSYDEVLAALKHQDEKLNRTLTAIAFLTAAGVTLFTRLSGSPIRFPESRISVTAFFFVVFL